MLTEKLAKCQTSKVSTETITLILKKVWKQNLKRFQLFGKAGNVVLGRKFIFCKSYEDSGTHEDYYFHPLLYKQ